MYRILTVDGGGDKFSYALVESGRVEPLGTLPSPSSLKGIREQILELMPGGLKGCSGLGFAIAGVVRDYSLVVKSPNLLWLNNTNLREWIKKEFGISCLVLNDLEAAGIAELKEGELKGVRCGILDTISTGLGGCTLIRVPGCRELVIPGEPGHMVNFGLEGPLCGCGKFGCNEARYSGGTVRKKVQRLFGDRIPPGVDGCKFLDQEMEKGSAWALQLYKEVGEGIGIGWVNTLNRNAWIEKIVYMGKFGVNGMKYILPHIQEVIRIGAMFPNHKQIPIVRSSLWPDGAHLGAAFMVEQGVA